MTPLRVLASARAVVWTVGRAAAVHAYEVGALASTAAMAGLCAVGGRFEPASSMSPHTKAHTAPTARPVLLVHGFGGTTSSWSVIARALRLSCALRRWVPILRRSADAEVLRNVLTGRPSAWIENFPP